MRRLISKCVVLGLCAVSLFAQPHTLEIRPDLPVGADTGVCLLRFNLAGSADIILEGDRAIFRSRGSASPFNATGVCSAPIPREPLDYFRLERTKGKGRVLLVENPADRNQFQAWIRIDNETSTPDSYDLRISWRASDGTSQESSRELRLVPRGRTQRRWVAEGSNLGASALPGTPLSSYDNDPLRYDTGPSGQLEFRGHVDDVVEFIVRGDRLNVVQISGQKVKVERFRFTQPMPVWSNLQLSVEKKDGRGTVELLETPSRANSFTARIRVSDPQGGSDRYHWVLSWRK
jgi:hypothetical protein